MELGSPKPMNIWSHQKLEEAIGFSVWPSGRACRQENREEVVAVVQVSHGDSHDQRGSREVVRRGQIQGVLCRYS